jgi:hypothetical protein
MDHIPGPYAIHLPDGRVASETEMREVGSLLQLYVRNTEKGLPDIADSAEHDRIIDFLRLLAKRFNDELRLFRAAEEERRDQREMLLARRLAQCSSIDGTARTTIRH